MGWHCLDSWLQPSMENTAPILTSETPVALEGRLTRVLRQLQSNEPQMVWVWHYLRSVF